MKRLEWITWKTEETELINPDELVEKLKERFQDYNSYMNPVVNENLIETIRLDALEQRKREVHQLVLKIEEKIEKDKRLIENSKEAQQKYIQSSLSETSDNMQTVIDLTQKRINLLTKKLESITNK